MDRRRVRAFRSARLLALALVILAVSQTSAPAQFFGYGGYGWRGYGYGGYGCGYGGYGYGYGGFGYGGYGLGYGWLRLRRLRSATAATAAMAATAATATAATAATAAMAATAATAATAGSIAPGMAGSERPSRRATDWSERAIYRLREPLFRDRTDAVGRAESAIAETAIIRGSGEYRPGYRVVAPGAGPGRFGVYQR